MNNKSGDELLMLVKPARTKRETNGSAISTELSRQKIQNELQFVLNVAFILTH